MLFTNNYLVYNYHIFNKYYLNIKIKFAKYV